MPLDVPLADIAVHDPDARRLIAFLKAMEFNTLTRRVAEFSGADPAEIEPDEKLKAGRAADQSQLPLGTAGAPAGAASSPGQAATASRHGNDGATPLTPQALSAARSEAARSAKVDRARYETVQTIDRLSAWVARASDVGVVARATQAESRSMVCTVS